MTKLLALLAMVISTAAMAECTAEAQLIGKVKNLEATAHGYSYQIELSNHFLPNELCPILKEEVDSIVLSENNDKKLKNGDIVSGVLTFNNETQAYELE